MSGRGKRIYGLRHWRRGKYDYYALGVPREVAMHFDDHQQFVCKRDEKSGDIIFSPITTNR